jgi:hypothetical protein
MLKDEHLTELQILVANLVPRNLEVGREGILSAKECAG